MPLKKALVDPLLHDGQMLPQSLSISQTGWVTLAVCAMTNHQTYHEAVHRVPRRGSTSMTPCYRSHCPGPRMHFELGIQVYHIYHLKGTQANQVISGDITRWHQNGGQTNSRDSDNLFGSGEFHLTWQKGEWEEDLFRWTNLNLRVRSSDTLNGLIFSSSFWQHFRLWKQLAVKSVEVIVLVSLMPRVRILIAFSVKDTFPILSTKKSCNNSSYGNFTVLCISPVAYPDFFYWNQQFVKKKTPWFRLDFETFYTNLASQKSKKLNKSCLFSSSHTSKSHGLDEKDVSWWFLIASSSLQIQKSSC